MAIWLKVWASDEYDGVHFAVVDVTPGRASCWLARMDGVSELAGPLGNARSVGFDDESIVFYEHIEELDALMEDLDAEEIIVVRRPVGLPACSVVPHEITRLIVTPSEMYWRSHREGTSTILITTAIPRMLLEMPYLACPQGEEF